MKAVIYARCSSTPKTDDPIERQISECREYAEKNGISVVQEYIDCGYPASIEKRPSFLKMIDDSRKQQFDTILVVSPDRITRKTDEYRQYRDTLTGNGVKIVSTKEIISGLPTEKYLDLVLDGKE